MSSEHKPEHKSDHKKDQGHEKTDAHAEGKKPIKKWLIIGAIIALVLVIISAAVFFFFFKNKAHNKKAAESAKEEKKETEQKPGKEEKKGEGEPKKPDEKTFYPAIYFSERLTLPLAPPVKEGDGKAKKMTLKKAKEEEEQPKEGQKLLVLRLALEFENEEEKKAFEKYAPELLKQIGAVVATKNKDGLLQFSEKLKMKLEISRIAEKVTDGKNRPKNIFFTEFTIQ